MKRNPPKHHKILHFSNAHEHVFHGFGNLVIWLWKTVGEVLEIFLKKSVRTPITTCFDFSAT